MKSQELHLLIDKIKRMPKHGQIVAIIRKELLSVRSIRAIDTNLDASLVNFHLENGQILQYQGNKWVFIDGNKREKVSVRWGTEIIGL